MNFLLEVLNFFCEKPENQLSNDIDKILVNTYLRICDCSEKLINYLSGKKTTKVGHNYYKN